MSAASVTPAVQHVDPTLFGLNEVAIVAIVGLVAAAIAIWTIFSQRGITARQATLDFIMRSEADADLIRARRTFTELAAKPEGLSAYAHRTAWSRDESRAIRMVLNECELIAVAIERGIIDDVVHRRWARSSFISYWDRAAPYILVARQQAKNDTLYYEFEQIVKWYKGSTGRMPNRRFFWRKFV